ncbi:hypothetical protein GQ42DRAFT_177727 [Ramicandelaber brevisporus]|nr:hypothetical protein GQ42DRAFT_177727 [Ramicandelaber brevisporus]
MNTATSGVTGSTFDGERKLTFAEKESSTAVMALVASSNTATATVPKEAYNDDGSGDAPRHVPSLSSSQHPLSPLQLAIQPGNSSSNNNNNNNSSNNNALTNSLIPTSVSAAQVSRGTSLHKHNASSASDALSIHSSATSSIRESLTSSCPPPPTADFHHKRIPSIARQGTPMTIASVATHPPLRLQTIRPSSASAYSTITSDSSAVTDHDGNAAASIHFSDYATHDSNSFAASEILESVINAGSSHDASQSSTRLTRSQQQQQQQQQQNNHHQFVQNERAESIRRMRNHPQLSSRSTARSARYVHPIASDNISISTRSITSDITPAPSNHGRLSRATTFSRSSPRGSESRRHRRPSTLADTDASIVRISQARQLSQIGEHQTSSRRQHRNQQAANRRPRARRRRRRRVVIQPDPPVPVGFWTQQLRSYRRLSRFEKLRMSLLVGMSILQIIASIVIFAASSDDYERCGSPLRPFLICYTVMLAVWSTVHFLMKLNLPGSRDFTRSETIAMFWLARIYSLTKLCYLIMFVVACYLTYSNIRSVCRLDAPLLYGLLVAHVTLVFFIIAIIFVTIGLFVFCTPVLVWVVTLLGINQSNQNNGVQEEVIDKIPLMRYAGLLPSSQQAQQQQQQQQSQLQSQASVLQQPQQPMTGLDGTVSSSDMSPTSLPVAAIAPPTFAGVNVEFHQPLVRNRSEMDTSSSLAGARRGSSFVMSLRTIAASIRQPSTVTNAGPTLSSNDAIIISNSGGGGGGGGSGGGGLNSGGDNISYNGAYSSYQPSLRAPPSVRNAHGSLSPPPPSISISMAPRNPSITAANADVSSISATLAASSTLQYAPVPVSASPVVSATSAAVSFNVNRPPLFADNSSRITSSDYQAPVAAVPSEIIGVATEPSIRSSVPPTTYSIQQSQQQQQQQVPSSQTGRLLRRVRRIFRVATGGVSQPQQQASSTDVASASISVSGPTTRDNAVSASSIMDDGHPSNLHNSSHPLVAEVIGSMVVEFFRVPYYRLSVLITTDSILGRVPEERNLWSTLVSMPVTDILVIAPIMALIPYYAILTNPVAEKIVRAFSSTTETNNQGSTPASDLNSRAVDIVNTLIGNLILVPYGIVTAIYYADVDRAVFGGSVWQIIQAIYSNFGPVDINSLNECCKQLCLLHMVPAFANICITQVGWSVRKQLNTNLVPNNLCKRFVHPPTRNQQRKAIFWREVTCNSKQQILGGNEPGEVTKLEMQMQMQMKQTKYTTQKITPLHQRRCQKKMPSARIELATFCLLGRRSAN